MLMHYEDLVNGWLFKYYGVNIEDVPEKYPDIKDSRDFYKRFPVTQSQYDEWEAWAKEQLYKIFKRRYSKKYIDRKWGMMSLNCAPSVKDSIPPLT